MSHLGKMYRGEKWYSKRNLDGELPKEISNDPAKMCDIEYFLENSKEKPKTKEKK